MNPFAAIALIAIPTVGGLVAWMKWNTFGKRASKPLAIIYNEEGLSGVLELKEFENLMNAVGKCYSVAPEKLRLSDSFKKELAAMDSWCLGDGSECMGKFVTDKYPNIRLEDITTIRDLLFAIAGR